MRVESQLNCVKLSKDTTRDASASSDSFSCKVCLCVNMTTNSTNTTFNLHQPEMEIRNIEKNVQSCQSKSRDKTGEYFPNIGAECSFLSRHTASFCLKPLKELTYLGPRKPKQNHFLTSITLL